jgi:hypothetical protein
MKGNYNQRQFIVPPLDLHDDEIENYSSVFVGLLVYSMKKLRNWRVQSYMFRA